MLFSTQCHCVQVCGLPQCSDFNLMLYVVLPAAVALVMVAVILGLCCLRQTHKKPLSVVAVKKLLIPVNKTIHTYKQWEYNISTSAVLSYKMLLNVTVFRCAACSITPTST